MIQIYLLGNEEARKTPCHRQVDCNLPVSHLCAIVKRGDQTIDKYYCKLCAHSIAHSFYNT